MGPEVFASASDLCTNAGVAEAAKKLNEAVSSSARVLSNTDLGSDCKLLITTPCPFAPPFHKPKFPIIVS